MVNSSQFAIVMNMGAHELFIAQSDLVLPSGALLQARITPAWGVEINGTRQELYSPEQAVCLSAFFDNPDLLFSKTELIELVSETYQEAVANGAEQVEPAESETFLRNAHLLHELRTNRQSNFRENLLTLGHGIASRFVLFRNTADEGYGLRKIDDFIESRPTLQHLKTAYVASFLQKMTLLNVVPRETSNRIVREVDREQRPTRSAPVVQLPQADAPDARRPRRAAEKKVSPKVQASRKTPQLEPALPPQLDPNQAIRELGKRVEGLPAGADFTVESLFPGETILASYSRLRTGISTLLQYGLIELVEKNGTTSTYRRTSKAFR